MSAAGWSQVAQAWERRASDIEKTNGDATRVLLEAAGIKPGERVLELGAGTGHLARELAELVGRDGALLATDVAPAMVELIEQKLADVPQASAAVVDAAAIAGPAEEYDVVVSRMGLMFVPEPLRALQEVRRVLRPGGRLATAVWADASRNPWMASVGFAVAVNGLQCGLPDQPGGPFSLGDAARLESLAREAGFTEVAVEEVAFTRNYASAAEQFDMVRVLAPPIAAVLATASDEVLEAVRTVAEEALAPYACADGGYDLPACALVLRAS